MILFGVLTTQMAAKERVVQPILFPKMVYIRSGTFLMGNTRNDIEGDEDEKHVHIVELTYDYEIGKYEVTNSDYLEFINDAKVSSLGYLDGVKVVNLDSWSCEFEYDNGEFYLREKGKENYPVINVSWDEAINYCNWLSEKKGLAKAYDKDGNLIDIKGNITGNLAQVEGYHLPTEAEWEYSARGGHKSEIDYKYSGSNVIHEVGWYWKNSGDKKTTEDWCFYGVLENNSWTHEIGQKQPNEIGIYDMSGNVWEWCHDYYCNMYYENSPHVNPVNSKRSSYRVARGGSWFLYAKSSRVSNRFMFYSFLRDCDIGIRVTRTILNEY